MSGGGRARFVDVVFITGFQNDSQLYRPDYYPSYIFLRKNRLSRGALGKKWPKEAKSIRDA